MDKAKRSYFLPSKLVAVFDKECNKGGYVRERVVAASLARFLNGTPTERAAMFDELESMLKKK